MTILVVGSLLYYCQSCCYILMTIFALAIGAYIQWISTGGNFLQLLPSVSLE